MSDSLLTRREWLKHSVLSTQYLALAARSPDDTELAREFTLAAPSTWTSFARDVEITEDYLIVGLADGRTVSAPLQWYPRLANGTPAERNNWEIGSGIGIHWPDLDEDISVEGLLLGGPSQESAKSLKRWLDQRQRNLAG